MCDSKLYHVFVYTVYLVIEDSANLTVFKKNSHQHNLQLIETWLNLYFYWHSTKIQWPRHWIGESLPIACKPIQTRTVPRTSRLKCIDTDLVSSRCLQKPLFSEKLFLTLSYQDYLQIQLCFVYCFGDPQPPNTL